MSAPRLALFTSLAVFAIGGLLAAAEAPAPSPYAGMESRRIPAISPEREKGLIEGTGLGLAMVAELNGQAGPRHALDLGEQLALTADQRASLQASFERMRTDAVALGRQILDAEEELNRRFVHRHIDEAKLAELTSRIAELEGKLRFVHLRAHLETDALLTEVQRQRYVELRGYRCCGAVGAAAMDEHHHPG